MLWAHNIHRANHSVAPLTWNTTLAEDAQEIGETCIWGHNVNGGGYGQNLASNTNVGDTLSMWYNGEIAQYDPSNYGLPTPKNAGELGHFTQVVWNATRTVGCATIVCPDMNYTVCNYYPGGMFS
ncbi:PR-1-like protein [Saccharata proteae CBS 121410]|uniref:PR-1-like protein n=1 Tax=Saccharata proteae CBS 121410 TaxID=1314787 RepID=A0A9P4LW56_9PEZI|nr:PR-1-like protein [Saccharata proteae CBS 121410]